LDRLQKTGMVIPGIYPSIFTVQPCTFQIILQMKIITLVVGGQFHNILIMNNKIGGLLGGLMPIKKGKEIKDGIRIVFITFVKIIYL